MQNHSYENDFDLHENETASCKRFHTLTRFETDTHFFFYFSSSIYRKGMQAKANLDGPCLNKQITKIYRQKNRGTRELGDGLLGLLCSFI